MTSEALTHQRNLQCNLLFLQQEHASTLKALHQEIAKLQKKCSELTFELAMVTPQDVDRDDAEKMKRLVSDLEENRKQQSEMRQDSEKKDKRMKMLEQQLKAQEKKFQDELKTKNGTINTLKRELDSKSNNIAFLTTELHRIKKKLNMCAEDENLSDSINNVMPVPPREGAPRARRSAYKRVEAGGGGRQPSGVGRRPARENSARIKAVALPDSTSDILDPTPFLHRTRLDKKQAVRIKPAPPPLPPIAAQAIHDARNNSGGHVVFRRDGRGRGSRIAQTGSSPEVETLAVDQVPGTTGTGKWAPAHESRSSEYN